MSFTRVDEEYIFTGLLCAADTYDSAGTKIDTHLPLNGADFLAYYSYDGIGSYTSGDAARLVTTRWLRYANKHAGHGSGYSTQLTNDSGNYSIGSYPVDKVRLVYKMFITSYPTLDENGFLDTDKFWRTSYQRRLTHYENGSNQGLQPTRNPEMVQADVGSMQKVYNIFSEGGDYLRDYWCSLYLTLTTYATSYTPDADDTAYFEEVMYMSSLAFIQEPWDAYIYDGPESVERFEAADCVNSDILDSKVQPTMIPVDYSDDSDAPDNMYELDFTYSELVKNSIWYRYGKMTDGVGEDGSSSRQEGYHQIHGNFMDKAIGDLGIVVQNAAEIPKEFRVRMQAAENFDQRKLTAMQTADSVTPTAPIVESGGSGTGGSY